MTSRKTADIYDTVCHVADPDTVVVQGQRFVRERTCKVTPSKNLQGIVVCECGEPFPEYYDYCPYCGAKVVE